jgi:2-polyprenyl-3-methyl-5-hydroxy-6-metoxy-1,4-benzoquinol methylase
MSWSCSQDIEDALWKAADQCLSSDAIKGAALERAVVERSLRYTSERERISETLVGTRADSDLAARALFFTISDAPKIRVPVAELRFNGLLPERVLRVADLGAGCGAMSWGLLEGTELDLKVTGIDSDRRALQLFAAAVAALPDRLRRRLDLDTRIEDIRELKLQGSYDLIISGSVLNEISEAEHLAMIREWMEHLEPGGSVIIVEPALRHTARALHRLRDVVLETSVANVYAPCTRSLAPCPMLANESDWCHEDRPTSLPTRAAGFAARTRLRNRGLKFSYLVLRHDSQKLADSGAARVVSRVRKLKGRHEGFLCSQRGRERVRLLKRDRNQENRAFLDSQRGDILLGVDSDRVTGAVRRLTPADEA